MASKIVLFDLASREPRRGWSANAWKTRLLLNIKGLDYETEWLEYPEIKPRLKPHVEGKEMYGIKDMHTVPTIILPDGTYVMDSWEIAQTIEKLHPTPSLSLDSPLIKKYSDLLDKGFWELIPNYILKVPEHVLNEASIPYWFETRDQMIGMPIQQLAKERGGEQAYKAAAPFLQQITAMLKENGGPFFMGKQICYADALHAGFLTMFSRLGNDVFMPVLEATGDAETHLEFLKAMKPYTDRDSY